MSPTRRGAGVGGRPSAGARREAARERIDAPGAYLLLESGALARVRKERPSSSRSAPGSIEVPAAKLSDDPNEESSVLRELAETRNYRVAF